MEYLPIVAEELPKGKKANESSMCPYMGRGEQRPRMTKGQTFWYLGEAKKLSDTPEQVAFLWDEKQRGFLSHLIINQARPCFVSKIRLDGVCLGWCGHGPDGLSLTKEGISAQVIGSFTSRIRPHPETMETESSSVYFEYYFCFIVFLYKIGIHLKLVLYWKVPDIVKAWRFTGRVSLSPPPASVDSCQLVLNIFLQIVFPLRI